MVKRKIQRKRKLWVPNNPNAIAFNPQGRGSWTRPTGQERLPARGSSSAGGLDAEMSNVVKKHVSKAGSSAKSLEKILKTLNDVTESVKVGNTTLSLVKAITENMSSMAEDALSLVMKKSFEPRGRVGSPGKVHRTNVTIGSSYGYMFGSQIRTNGTIWQTHWDTLREVGTPNTVTNNTNRQSLSPSWGFNQKYMSFGNYYDHPNMVDIFNDGGFTSTNTNQDNKRDNQFYCGVLRYRVRHTFSNTSNVLPINIRVTVFMPRSTAITNTILSDNVLGNTSQSATARGTFPSKYVLANTTFDAISGFQQGSIMADPSTTWAKSAYFRRNCTVVASEKVTLNPNDIWELKIEEIFKSGLDYDTVVNGGLSADTIQRTRSYFIGIEAWGPKVDAIQFDPAIPSSRAAFIGTAPGSFTREVKKDALYVPSQPYLRSSNTDVNATSEFFNSDSSLYTIVGFQRDMLRGGDRIFNVPMSQIGAIGESGKSLAIPILTDGAITSNVSYEGGPQR